MAIISIIAAFMMPNFLGVQDRVKEAGVRSVMHSVQLAIESFNMENTYYPQGSNISIKQLCDDYLVEPGYLAAIPKNPFTGREYQDADNAGRIVYLYNDAKGTYVLTGYKRDSNTVLQELTNNM